MRKQVLIEYLKYLIESLEKDRIIEGMIEFHPNATTPDQVFDVNGVIRYVDGVSILDTAK